jgi:SHS2 domain-containing protein
MLQAIDYFDHEADIGIIGRGIDVESAFINGARAMFAIMTDISRVSPTQCFEINFIEADLELAFVTWLNLLLGKARENSVIFSKFTLSRQADVWRGTASGDEWREIYTLGTEVKGATLTMLKVTKNELWEACCVVDV